MRRIIFLTVLAAFLLSGCAIAPHKKEFVSLESPMQFDFLQPDANNDKPLTVALPLPRGNYKGCLEDHQKLAEELRSYVENQLKQCPSKYTVIDHTEWRKADIAIDVVLKYLGESREKAFSNAITPSALSIAVTQPAQKLAQPIAAELVGGSMGAGSVASIAGPLYMFYDIGKATVNSVRSIGKTYAKCELAIVDMRPARQGMPKPIFRTNMVTTIELKHEDEYIDKQKLVPDFGESIVTTLTSNQCNENLLSCFQQEGV
jgi:hypothetical protein